MKLSIVAQKIKDISLAGERIAVIGGTQGIGEGVACRFAQAGAEVWIVGRNEGKAKIVLEKLNASSSEQKLDPAPEHTFLKADLSLIGEAHRVARDMRSRAGERGIDYLVMTQGGLPDGNFTLTKEGYEQHYAVQVLSRFILAHDLAADPASSLVKKAVMSIMSPAKTFGKRFDSEDIDLQKANKNGSYGFFAALARDSIVVDSFTQDLSKGNPKINFTHVFPGAVRTDITRNSNAPWWMSLVSTIGFKLGLSTTPLQYAAIPFYLLASPEGRSLAAQEMYTNETLTKLEPHAVVRDDDVRKKIRLHLLRALGEEE